MRVWVLDSEGRQASFEWPRVVPAVNVEELVRASYRPDTPAHLQIETEGEEGAVSYTELYCTLLYCTVLQVSATWSHVHCAQLYDVTYTAVTTRTTWSVQAGVSHKEEGQLMHRCVDK